MSLVKWDLEVLLNEFLDCHLLAGVPNQEIQFTLSQKSVSLHKCVIKDLKNVGTHSTSGTTYNFNKDLVPSSILGCDTLPINVNVEVRPKIKTLIWVY